MINYQEGYIICENHIKTDILNELALNNEFKNYTFLTLKELKQKLSFSVKKQAVIYLSSKLNISPYVAKEYINSLMILHDSFNSKKGEFLKGIYDLLDEQDFIIKSDLFISQIKNCHFTFIDYPKTKELDYVIGKLNSEFVSLVMLDDVKFSKQLKCHQFGDIEGECAFLFSEIYKLIESGVSVKDIVICNMNNDYEFILNRYVNTYKLPITPNLGNNIISTNESKMFFRLIDEGLSFDQILEKLNQAFYDKSIVNKIINLINEYDAYLYNPKDLVLFFQMEFKNIKYNSLHYEEEIKLISQKELNKHLDKHVFFVNFNVEVPAILKDEAYLLDKEKEALGLDTTQTLNKINKFNLINAFELCKHLTITFSKNHSFNSLIPSPLIKELKMDEVNHKADDYPFGYDKVNDDLYMSKAYDNFYKFNENNIILKNHIYDGFLHNTYDNRYKAINKKIIEEIYENGLTLSYTDMHTYLQCPFKFYCKKILNIDEFESTLSARLGTYAHGILQDFETKDALFDFEESALNWLEDDQRRNGLVHTSKELYFFNKFKNHIKYVIERIKAHKCHTKLGNALSEKKFDIKLYDNKLTFKGYIDKVLYSNDLEYVAIIDYKTGTDKASLNNLIYGENLQLPVYIYLLKNDKSFANSKIVGVYLQKIDIIIPEKNDKLSDLDQINNNLRYEGYTDNEYVDILDDTKGDHLKNFSLKNDGSVSAKSLIFDQIDVEELYKIVEEKIDYTFKGIMNADFRITDNVIGNETVSCKYCKFKDVCFKTYKDKVYLQKVTFKEKAGVKNENE